jgi:hypothetical protein
MGKYKKGSEVLAQMTLEKVNSSLQIFIRLLEHQPNH